MSKQEIKHVPSRRFKDFENAPAWEQHRLTEVADRYDNLRVPVSSNLRVPGKTPYYGANGIQDYVEGYTHEGEFVLVAEDGANDLREYPVRCVQGKIWVNNHAHVLQGKEDIADNKFLALAIKKADIASLLVGGGRAKLNAEILMNIELRLPTYEEQKRIGQYFERINSLLVLHQRKLEKLKRLKTAYLSEMFPAEGEREPKRRFKGFTDAWEQHRLGALGETFTGLSGKSKKDFGHGEAQFVTYMNVYTNPISDLCMTEQVEIDDRQNEVKYGDVFFTTSSETPDEVGMSSVWLGKMENTYLNSFCFGYRPTEEIDVYYMAYMLRSDTIRKKLILLAQGISRYNISKNRVMDIEVFVPALEEQKRVGLFFKNLDSLIALHQRKLEKLKRLKTAYLNELFV
ncbi:MAG: restriction endonuclease subunit S [Aerococcus sp.]|nr:restriction endonuclease subunit S [Aerococcus sp.]